jgi:hypothetical protein
MTISARVDRIIDSVMIERGRQEKLFADKKLPAICSSDNATDAMCATVLGEEVMEVVEEQNLLLGAYHRLLRTLNDKMGNAPSLHSVADMTLVRAELVQVAAVAIGWIERLDRKIAKRDEEHASSVV